MTLSEQLQDIVEGYFDRYPNMSINGLAQKSGVGATTLRRIVKGTNKGEPAPRSTWSRKFYLEREEPSKIDRNVRRTYRRNA